MRAPAFGWALAYVLLPFLRSNGFSVILWRALGWKKTSGYPCSLLLLSLVCIHQEVVALRCRAQMVCNYRGGEVVPFNLRQWKEDRQTRRIIIYGHNMQTKRGTIRTCHLDSVNLWLNPKNDRFIWQNPACKCHVPLIKLLFCLM